MGYGMCSMYSNNKFVIRDISALLKRMRDNREKISMLTCCHGSDFRNLEEVQEAIRWDFKTESLILKDLCKCGKCECNIEVATNYITGIRFEEGNLHDDYDLFTIFADLVEDGSYIEVTGEDGDKWRWVFNNGTVEEIHPKIVW